MNAGENNPNARLTEEDVIAIKRLLLLNEMTIKEIAKTFHVSEWHVQNIRDGKRWADVKIFEELKNIDVDKE